MPEDFKRDFSATFADSKRVMKRFRKTTKPLGYCLALYGSTLLDGKGHDIDLQALGTPDQKIDPCQLAIIFVKRHAKRVTLYEEHGLKGSSSVWLCFVTHDNLYIDLHIFGTS